MVNRPSVPEIITVNSEELQTLIRDLLPSQNGFGSELQASNVITPIIDLTATAEGSTLREDMQTAIAFGSQTAFSISNTTTGLANSPGYYRIFGVSSVTTTTAATRHNAFEMTDGLSTKVVWQHRVTGDGASAHSALQFDFVVWLASGESISGQSSAGSNHLIGSYRQIADSEGKFVNPSGFPL